MIDITFYVVFALALYLVGIYCLATKRNMMRLILGIEMIINAANINFVTFAAYAAPNFVDPMGNSFVIISIGLAGAMSAVAIAIIVEAYRHYGTLDVNELRRLKG